jgi:hypothetical protein
MTEDDTFRVLTQMPFERLRKIALRKMPDIETVEEAEIFLLRYGWTFDEFDRRLAEYNNYR